MTLNIGTWNSSNAAVDTPAGQDQLVAWLERDNLDAAVLPEACNESGDPEQVAALRQRLGEMGYRLALMPYGDTDDRQDRHSLGMAVRESALSGEVEVVRLGGTEAERTLRVGRAALRCALHDPEHADGTEIIFYGVHLDDRRRQTRDGQQTALLSQAGSGERRTIIAGDFNATHGTGLSGYIFRMIGGLAHIIPAVEPGTPKPRLASLEGIVWPIRRFASLAQRLGGMASRSVMRRFEAAGFRDADSHHRATMRLGGFAIAQLDHIIVSGGLVAVAEPRSDTPGREHLQLAASVEVVPTWRVL